jgi:hypothetical protein
VTSAGIKDTHNALSKVDLTVATDNTLALSVKTTDQTKSDAIALNIMYGEEGTTTAKLT